jgi:hypothetical protein
MCMCVSFIDSVRQPLPENIASVCYDRVVNSLFGESPP